VRVPSTMLLCGGLLLVGCSDPAGPAGPARPTAARLAAAAAPAFPEVIALPNGFSPEGITFGRGTTFYVGSIPTGAIYQADARTGAGALLVAAQPGRSAVGMTYDHRRDRLFVAGGPTGQAYVYDASTGATLAVYQLTAPGTLVNDVALTGDAAYFTDSFQPVLYRLPLGPGGALPAPGAVEVLPLTGDYQFVPGEINGNGIVATPDGGTLITVNSATGALYAVDPATGVATAIDLAGGAVPAGDGILLIGHTLYVVQGPFNQVSVVRLSPDYTSGVIERVITDADLAFPSTIGEFGGSLYAVNARFDVAPPPAPAPNVAFQVVRLPR